MSGKPHYSYAPGIALATQEDEQISRDAERADDETYQHDFATLVAVFRTRLQSQRDLITAKKILPISPAHEFARELKWLREVAIDGWGSPDAQFPQQAFEDWGPAILLRALATAYTQVQQMQGRGL